jgi:hypothetical protein
VSDRLSDLERAVERLQEKVANMQNGVPADRKNGPHQERRIPPKWKKDTSPF